MPRTHVQLPAHFDMGPASVSPFPNHSLFLHWVSVTLRESSIIAGSGLHTLPLPQSDEKTTKMETIVLDQGLACLLVRSGRYLVIPCAPVYVYTYSHVVVLFSSVKTVPAVPRHIDPFAYQSPQFTNSASDTVLELESITWRGDPRGRRDAQRCGAGPEACGALEVHKPRGQPWV